MRILVFSVFDSKVAVFGAPMFNQYEADMIRAFSDAVNDGSNANNMWFRHPEDYSLFAVGEFDNLTGELKGHLPRNLVTASALKAAGGQMELFKPNGEKKEAVVN